MKTGTYTAKDVVIGCIMMLVCFVIGWAVGRHTTAANAAVGKVKPLEDTRETLPNKLDVVEKRAIEAHRTTNATEAKQREFKLCEEVTRLKIALGEAVERLKEQKQLDIVESRSSQGWLDKAVSLWLPILFGFMCLGSIVACGGATLIRLLVVGKHKSIEESSPNPRWGTCGPCPRCEFSYRWDGNYCLHCGNSESREHDHPAD